MLSTATAAAGSGLFHYYRNCVGWPRNDVNSSGGLRDLIDDRLEITRATFLKYVDREELRELELAFGYASHPRQGLTMAKDWHVEYFRSKHHGEVCYGFKQSGIEYVFKRDEE